jgi:hypothetical protein
MLLWSDKRRNLDAVAKELRKEHWKLQQKAGIDLISLNDFSLYDGMLDMTVLLNAIPKEYQQLGLNEHQTYFAMARRYQGEQGDEKTLFAGVINGKNIWKCDYKAIMEYKSNREVFEAGRLYESEEIQAEVAALSEDDFSRKIDRKEREKIQKEEFGFPLVPTTTIGFFPQTQEVKKNRSNYRTGEIF